MNPRRFLFSCVMAVASVAAHAHAFLDHADPKVGSSVAAPPAELRLWFTQDVESAFTTVEVVDARGNRVDTAHAQVDASDRTLVHVPLGKLAPGAYTVNWRSVSVDTHASQGRFTFRVGP